MTIQTKSRRTRLVASAIALSVALGTGVALSAWSLGAGPVQAQTQGNGNQGATNGQGGTGGGVNQGNNGNQGANKGGEEHSDSGSEEGGKGPMAGQGGPGEDSDGKGPQAGAQGDNGGGKPIWAQEGIPEVELGRLNVARSPGAVLDRAYEEALASLTPEMASFYSLSEDDMIMQLSTAFDTVSYIDSPLQNLALLKDALDGSSVLNTVPGISNNTDLLQAVFLGTASDKTVPISPDTVTAVTTILGTPVTGAAAVALAIEAEKIRIAILAGHG
ncbi:MAG: hypothetical protein GC146_02510 [Limimaricola sp.]|uniref:hypothetical protein n=1 Tax=Limimaricola sp. TaxID=2211665 RepID=UPI001D965D24|nr:hypothetical protein [Limimaricola sp.]MBI1416072.1 hypothetical protein [Limimaricola sp.]